MITQVEMDGTVNVAAAGQGGCRCHRVKHMTVQGRWSEHMQDLTDWCMMMNKSQNNTTDSPQPSWDEQLNTPDSSVHGEFNFGLYDSGGNLVGLPKANRNCDLWRTPSPLHVHSDLCDSPGDIWLPPTNASTTPMVHDIDETFSPDFLKKYDAMKANGNVLLSQKPMFFKLQTHIKRKQSKKRLMSLFNSEEPKTSNFKMHSDPVESKQSRNGLKYKYYNLVPAVAIKVEEPDYIPIEKLDPLKILTDDSKSFDSAMKAPEYIIPDSVKYEIDDLPPFDLENGTDSLKTSSHRELVDEQPDLSPQPELERIPNQTAAVTTTDDLGLIVDKVGGFDLLSFVFNNNTQDFNSSLLLPDDSVLLPSISKTVQRNLCASPLIQTCSKNLHQPPSGKDQFYFAREDDDLKPVVSEVERLSKEEAQQKRQTIKRRYSSVSYDDSSYDAHNGTSDDDDMLGDASTSVRLEASGKNDANRRAPGKRNAGRQKKKPSVELESDPELVEPERYRELRDRNNEASRKSRLNRKSREIEIKQQAFVLERDNRKLRAKANEMEQLVIRLRRALMKMVLKKK